MNLSPLKVAVVGAGVMGRYHAMNYATMPRVDLVAVVDIDHFKRINDRYGHDVGDDALCHVADVLRRMHRTGDLIVRQGGEEFVLMLPGMGSEEAYQRMEQLRLNFIEHAFFSGEREVPLTVSIGLTWRADGDWRVHQLMHRADAALYRAKKTGRNRVEMADPQVAPV